MHVLDYVIEFFPEEADCEYLRIAENSPKRHSDGAGIHS